MKPLIMLLVAASWSFTQEFKELSKAEVKEFGRAAIAIEGAYNDYQYTQIRTFGPGILSRYSAVQIQADGFAKEMRETYARTDSIVAYSILRQYIDSLKLTITSTQTMEGMYTNLKSADRIENAFATKPILSRFDFAFADSTRAAARKLIETSIPDFFEVAKRAGKLDQAFALINGLSYRSAVPASAKLDVIAAIESAYFDAMSSNSAQKIRAFARSYPDYRPDDIRARLDVLDGDEIAFLLQRGSQTDLLDFLVANPTAPQIPNIKKRLMPMLYRSAFDNQDIATCQQYLTLFPDQNIWRRNIESLQSFLIRSQTTDTTATTFANGYRP